MDSLYKAVSDKTGRLFGKVTDGQLIHLGKPDEPIPDEHLIKYTEFPLKDGVYSLGIFNCGSADCSVGVPNPECIEKGVYAEGKCAVYSLNSPNINIELDDVIDTMMHLMDEVK